MKINSIQLSLHFTCLFLVFSNKIRSRFQEFGNHARPYHTHTCACHQRPENDSRCGLSFKNMASIGLEDLNAKKQTFRMVENEWINLSLGPVSLREKGKALETRLENDNHARGDRKT